MLYDATLSAEVSLSNLCELKLSEALMFLSYGTGSLLKMGQIRNNVHFDMLIPLPNLWFRYFTTLSKTAWQNMNFLEFCQVFIWILNVSFASNSLAQVDHQQMQLTTFFDVCKLRGTGNHGFTIQDYQFLLAIQKCPLTLKSKLRLF